MLSGKIKISLFLPLFLFCFFSLHAQEKKKTPPATINQQFSEILEEANNYKDYKVVKEYKLIDLKEQITEKLSQLKAKIDSSEVKISQQKSKIESVQKKLKSTQKALKKIKASRDQISFLGMKLTKSGLKNTFWIVAAILVLIIIILIIKNRKDIADTKESKIRLEQEQRDFDDFRKKSLEKQQKLGRKLQDEINKNKKSNNSDL